MLNPEADHHETLPGPAELPRLAADLVQLTSRPTPDTAEIDAIVADAARQALRATDERWFVGRRVAKWSAAAAAVLLIVAVVSIAQLVNKPPTPSSDQPGAIASGAAGDLDHNGRIDILDAFLLARSLEAGRTMIAADVNGDGVVDHRDVDALAALAVALPERKS